MNPAHDRILKHFTYLHLREDIQFAIQPVCDIAEQTASILSDSNDPAEVTAGLRKLLEAKDCFVRARLA